MPIGCICNCNYNPGLTCASGSTTCTGRRCSLNPSASGSAYNGTCTLSNSVIHTTGPSTVVPPDAGGGSGSFPTALQSVLTTGLSCNVDNLLGEFDLGSFTCLLHVNANQGITPAAAPACVAATNSVAGTKGLSAGAKSLLIWAV